MKKHWWQKEVVYQIYPKSFKDSDGDGIGDIKGITNKLDYLEYLGITVIWICPIYQSPMDDNGYDVADYRQVAPEFGTMEDLEELIGKASEKGIKIILDLVINHTSDEHEWFKNALADPDSRFHDYYIFKEGDEAPNNWRSVFGGSVWEKVPGRSEYYFHAFGKKQPDLNWENEEVREKLYEMVNWWLDKGIAGFRIDAITFIKKDLTFESREPDGSDGLVKCTKTSRNQAGIGTFLHELKERTFDKYDCMTVAEAPGVPYEELEEFIGEQGYFSMIFDFRYADLDVASGSEWFKRIPWTVKELKEKIMCSQMALQKCGWGANFIENHDQPRAASKYLKEDAQNADAVKMMAAMYFFLRGTPFIYQGQELGMVNFKRKGIGEFNDISSLDQYYRSIDEGLDEQDALNIVNLRSRDNARTPFPWDDSDFGGFSTAKPWLGMNETYPQINAKSQIGDPDSVLEFYREMIELRNREEYRDCLVYGDIEPLESCGQVIAYVRKDKDKKIYCYFNFSNESADVCLPEKGLDLFWGNRNDAGKQGDRFTLQPYQAALLK